MTGTRSNRIGDHRFFSVEDDGPVPLELPPEIQQWSDVYDRVELGVYSRLRSYPRVRFFGLHEHLARTDHSQRLLGIPHRLDHELLRRSIQVVIAAQSDASTFVRFDLLSRPAAALGTQSATLLSVAPFVAVPDNYLSEGVGAVFSDLVRNNPLAKRAAFVRERGGYASGGQQAYERLLTSSDGRILEGSSSNFFGLIDGCLRTASEGVLQGITKRFCLLLARELGFTIEERTVALNEVEQLEEAFLTSSSRGVVPIVRIEGRPVGNGRPGPRTERLRAAYDEKAAREAQPAWPV